MELFSVPYFLPLSLALAAAFAVRELATWRAIRWMKYLFTPMVTILIIFFVVVSIADDGFTLYRVCILAALLLSLAADTMLMIEETSLMQYGIVYFLLAHIAYIVSFSIGVEFKIWNIPVGVVLVVLLMMFNKGIRGHVGNLEAPIMMYAFVLILMLFMAVSTLNADITVKNVVICSGAIMFVVSDLLLAFLTFIRPYKHESVVVWALYAPAQLLFAISCFY